MQGCLYVSCEVVAAGAACGRETYPDGGGYEGELAVREGAGGLERLGSAADQEGGRAGHCKADAGRRGTDRDEGAGGEWCSGAGQGGAMVGLMRDGAG